MIALFLALLIVVQLGIIYARSRHAANDASALLSAIRLEQQERAEETPVPSGMPLAGEGDQEDQDPEAVETPGVIGLPGETPDPAGLLEESDPETEPDPLADYVQPEAPEVTEESEILAKVREKAGEDAVIGILSIPKIDEELPVIGTWSYSLLKISVCRYTGPDPNAKGNLIILGHNYKNGSHFGKLDKLKTGDEIRLEDMAGNETVYVVTDTETIAPTDFSALEKFEGETAMTLVTCTNGGNSRLVVRCTAQP